jgi:hypothetical protein
MLPDGPPPVPKHKYFKKINKTENHFSVFYIRFYITDMLRIFFVAF